MKIVSYALFKSEASVYHTLKGGNSLAQFTKFLPLLVRAHQVLWAGYEMWLHHDRASMMEPYFKALVKFDQAGFLKLVDCGTAGTLCGAMLWRMKPAFETDAEAVVCRDVDVIPAPFDRQAVEEWLHSRHAVHVVHFCQAHSGVMGGTLAVRPSRFRELVACRTLEQFMDRGTRSGNTFERHGDDQHLLNQHYLPLSQDMLLHELHHEVGDLPAVDVRRKIDWPMPLDIPLSVATRADTFSPGIGLCAEPAPALAFYDALDIPAIHRIREIERSVL